MDLPSPADLISTSTLLTSTGIGPSHPGPAPSQKGIRLIPATMCWSRRATERAR